MAELFYKSSGISIVEKGTGQDIAFIRKEFRGTNTISALKKATNEIGFISDAGMAKQMEIEAAPSRLPIQRRFLEPSRLRETLTSKKARLLSFSCSTVKCKEG